MVAKTLEARGPFNLEIMEKTRLVRNKRERINQDVIIPLLAIDVGTNILMST